MVRELNPIDITSMPELDRLAEEVNRTGRPRRLRRGTEDIAVLIPAAPRTPRRRARQPSRADIDAFLSSAGSWKDADTDKLVADIYESRRTSRPPVEL